MTPTMPTVELIVNDPDAEKKLQKVTVKGEVDRDTMPDFRDKMEAFLQTFQQTNLVLDLENLEFINSEGIGYLSDVYNRFSTQSKKIMILRASARIMDIFQLVGLDQIIPCYNSDEECLQNAI
ncbi:STAS domain-containing protein [Patescibacteria group bacterium]